MSAQPMWQKCAWDPVYKGIIKALRWDNVQYRDLWGRLQPLIDQFGKERVQSATWYLLYYEGQMSTCPSPLAKVTFRREARGSCRQILGPAPDDKDYEEFYRVNNRIPPWPVPKKPEPKKPEAPKEQAPVGYTEEEFRNFDLHQVEGLARRGPELLEERPDADEHQRQTWLVNAQRAKAELERREKEARSGILPVPVPEGEPLAPPVPKKRVKEGRSQEDYAADAKKMTKRSLLCALRDARKKVKQHGKRSFAGKEGKKELAAVEAELHARAIVAPPPGEETKEWDDKKKPKKE
jgi:hypothetical protein